MTAGAHILVVDDNAANRKLVAALLTYEGYRVIEAADAAEGLALARAGGLQLVISDILMPSMDGYEFVRQLRAETATAELAVIFYTANYHQREATSLARQCGVARVLVKPCATPVFLQVIAEVLAGAGAKVPASAPDAGFDTEHLRLLTDKLSQKADALRAANTRLSVLTDINLQIASERDPQQLLNSVCGNARELLGARFAVLAVAAKTPSRSTQVCVSGLAAQLAQAVTDPREDAGVLGRVYAENRVVRLDDDEVAVDLGLPSGFPAVRAAIAVPVRSLTRTYGWLCVGEKLGARAFNAEDERLLTIIGAQVGRIYENGTLFREVQEQATQLMVEVEERQRVLAQLGASEELFRQLAENIQDVFFVASPDLTQIFYISPAFERIWGRPPDAWSQSAAERLAAVHPGDRERIAEELLQIVQLFPAHGQMEFRILHPDATTRWVLSRFFPIVDDSGKLVRTVGVTADITERKLAELRIVRLNRTYSVLSGINSLIVRATDRDALLRDACRLAVEQGGFRVAWCGLLDGTARILRPSAFAGDADDMAPHVSFSLDAETAKISLVVEALRTQLPQLCNDLTREDAKSLYRQEFVARGYRSMVALPLVVSAQVIGCFVLLTDACGYFDEEEMRLLLELAGDISFALDHIGKVERLHYLASFDPLTGLANRAAFVERIGQYLHMAAHTQARFIVAIADPERFEVLNNTLGREGGDELLRQAATRFAAAAGGADVVAHIGSDKFAAIIPGAYADFEAARLLEEFWDKWLAAPFCIGGQSVELTAKAGVAIFPADGDSANALLANAEAALRAAKEGGKTFGFYTANLSERFTERRALDKSLRRALENEEFVVHYQPKVDLLQRRVTGVEALIRWRRPEHGLVPPTVFIPLLEENGMIVEVGEWVLRRASLDRARWLELHLPAPRVAVNVSAVQLRRDDFVGRVSRIVNMAGGEAGLDIEITETLLLTDVAENLVKLAQIRDLGIGIALDDFGTGYSSLGYLAKLPVGTLKIDRSFVASMLDDASAMTLVSTIIWLARSLKLQTVAEGVESEEQAKILRLIGCDQMQGYLISKPLPFEEMTAFLSRTVA